MRLIRGLIGASCKDKKERNMRYGGHLNEGEVASLWRGVMNEHQRN